jgi:hypothetical protein
LTFKAGTGKYSEISGFVNFFGMVNTLNGTAVDTVTGGKVYR